MMTSEVDTLTESLENFYGNSSLKLDYRGRVNACGHMRVPGSRIPCERDMYHAGYHLSLDRAGRRHTWANSENQIPGPFRR